jgi:PAS domain S-box-containing protein
VIDLRSLGATQLTDDRGKPLRAVLSQPKRLALLAYLATGEPGSSTSRTHLLGLLWPRLDEAHARNALNKALHFLRGQLPEGFLVSHGRTGVAIAPSQITCDAVLFRNHLEMGSEGEALRLYRGEFLMDLHVADAPTFQEWLDRERGRYHAQARTVGVRRVREDLGKGRVPNALEWCSVLSRIAPTDEDVVRVTVQSQMRAGNRAGAMECLETYEGWLREELGQGVPADLVRLLSDSVSATVEAGGPSPTRTDDPSPELLAESREAVKLETLEEYRDFVEFLPDMVYRCDLRGSFPYVNEATVRTMGWSREQFRDMSYDELVREDFRDRVIDFYVLQVDDRIPNTYLELPTVTKDGREVWVGQRVRLLERDGVPVGIESVTRDITSRVRRERANRRTALEDRETRLLNRDAFSLVGRQRIRENRRSRQTFFVIHVRVRPQDGEVEIPEAIVNRAMMVLGGILREAVRECDVLGRIDQTEIAIMASNGGKAECAAMNDRVAAVMDGARCLEELADVTIRCESVVHDPALLRSSDALMTFTWEL